MDGLDTLPREVLIARLQQMEESVVALQQRVAELEAQNELLRSQLAGKGPGNGLPPFVKPNRKRKEGRGQKERRKRGQSYTRRREEPTEYQEHALERCPDCGHKLSGGWVLRRRQQIEVPQVRVRVIEHVVKGRYCGVCGKTHVPKLGVAEGVLGKHRVGPGLMALIATLSKACRMPQKTIQQFLEWVMGVHLAAGEISGVLHAVAGRGEGEAARVLEEIRGSPVVHADETGWREDGRNGYLWSLSTPSARYFYRAASRAGGVIQGLLGERFVGVLVSDFYSGYNWYDGRQQRCWVHLLRDLKALAEAHAEQFTVTAWVEDVVQCYRVGKDVAGQPMSERERQQWRNRLTEELLALARPYLEEREAPQHVLAKRIEQFQDELFTFVQQAGVPADNNAAERAIRPAVTARKVSGGTRSAKGSATASTLMTLFGTWLLRGQNPLEACKQMLLASSTEQAV